MSPWVQAADQPPNKRTPNAICHPGYKQPTNHQTSAPRMLYVTLGTSSRPTTKQAHPECCMSPWVQAADQPPNKRTPNAVCHPGYKQPTNHQTSAPRMLYVTLGTSSRPAAATVRQPRWLRGKMHAWRAGDPGMARLWSNTNGVDLDALAGTLPHSYCLGVSARTGCPVSVD